MNAYSTCSIKGLKYGLQGAHIKEKVLLSVLSIDLRVLIYLGEVTHILHTNTSLGIRAGMAHFSLMWQSSLDIAHSQLKGT